MTKWIAQATIAAPDTPTAIQIGTMESLVNGAVIMPRTWYPASDRA